MMAQSEGEGEGGETEWGWGCGWLAEPTSPSATLKEVSEAASGNELRTSHPTANGVLMSKGPGV